jgi:hypothetical protein
MLLSRVGFVIFGYVIDTQAMFSVAVFIVGIVATEWASIASTLGIDEYRSASASNAEECAPNDLTDAQEAALSTMAAAFNHTCSITVRVGEEGVVFMRKANACDCE